jgi:hypothetical protein
VPRLSVPGPSIPPAGRGSLLVSFGGQFTCRLTRPPVSSRCRRRRRHAWSLRRRACPDRLRIPERLRVHLYDRRNDVSGVRSGRDVHRPVQRQRIRCVVRRNWPNGPFRESAGAVPVRERDSGRHRVLLLPLSVKAQDARRSVPPTGREPLRACRGSIPLASDTWSQVMWGRTTRPIIDRRSGWKFR